MKTINSNFCLFGKREKCSFNRTQRGKGGGVSDEDRGANHKKARKMTSIGIAYHLELGFEQLVVWLFFIHS